MKTKTKEITGIKQYDNVLHEISKLIMASATEEKGFKGLEYRESLYYIEQKIIGLAKWEAKHGQQF